MDLAEPGGSTLPATKSLSLLGISALEEAVYRALLRSPGSTAEMLADSLHMALPGVVTAVAELERKGFATHAPEPEPRLFPSPPDIAIESLLLHRQTELQLARLGHRRPATRTAQHRRRQPGGRDHRCRPGGAGAAV